jgi:hypothetical protein
MNCEYCEERVGCSLRKKHDDGTAAFSCGIDLGRDKSKTVICETRNSRLVAEYVLPVDGERANAEKLLVELAEKYGINLDEFEHSEEVVEHKIKPSSAWQRKLFAQLVGLMRQEKKKRGEMLHDKELEVYRQCIGTRFCNLEERFVYATKSDWIELMAKFEVLKAAYKRQQKSFYLAFLMANDLLTDPENDAPEPTPEQKKAYKAATFMSMGIERTSLHPQLENLEV